MCELLGPYQGRGGGSCCLLGTIMTGLFPYFILVIVYFFWISEIFVTMISPEVSVLFLYVFFNNLVLKMFDYISNTQIFFFFLIMDTFLITMFLNFASFKVLSFAFLLCYVMWLLRYLGAGVGVGVEADVRSGAIAGAGAGEWVGEWSESKSRSSSRSRSRSLEIEQLDWTFFIYWTEL